MTLTYPNIHILGSVCFHKTSFRQKQPEFHSSLNTSPIFTTKRPLEILEIQLWPQESRFDLASAVCDLIRDPSKAERKKIVVSSIFLRFLILGR